MRRFAILGAGGMGTALAVLLSRGAASVRLWARSPGQAEEMARTRKNARHLDGISLSPVIEPTHDVARTTGDADLIIVAIPSAFLRETLASLSWAIPPHVPVLSVVKGIERTSFARPSEIVGEVLSPRPVVVLSGPSHAEGDRARLAGLGGHGRAR